MIELPALPAGGPYTLSVEGKNKIQFKDVLIGEVWICSGQSNMKMQLRNTFEANKAAAAAANPKLRLFTVAEATAMGPLDKVTGVWKECSRKTAPAFSAVGYYFGRDLQKDLGVPVGLIHTSWGGTPAQAWTSKDGLEAVPALRHYHATLAERAGKIRRGQRPRSSMPRPSRIRASAGRIQGSSRPRRKRKGKPSPQAPRRPQQPTLRTSPRIAQAPSTTP